MRTFEDYAQACDYLKENNILQEVLQVGSEKVRLSKNGHFVMLKDNGKIDIPFMNTKKGFDLTDHLEDNNSKETETEMSDEVKTKGRVKGSGKKEAVVLQVLQGLTGEFTVEDVTQKVPTDVATPAYVATVVRKQCTKVGTRQTSRRPAFTYTYGK